MNVFCLFVVESNRWRRRTCPLHFHKNYIHPALPFPKAFQIATIRCSWIDAALSAYLYNCGAVFAFAILLGSSFFVPKKLIIDVCFSVDSLLFFWILFVFVVFLLFFMVLCIFLLVLFDFCCCWVRLCGCCCDLRFLLLLHSVPFNFDRVLADTFLSSANLSV